jgi:TolA-binding protein
VYKQFINDYKGAPESKNALNGIKNIYIGKNDAGGYLDYYKSVNGENSVSEFAQDSLIYLAGEDAYMKDNCTKSNEIFGSYNKKFPNGIFSLNALYYRADCFLKVKMPDSAAICYQSIIEKTRNKYTEASLFNLSQIQYNNAQYDKALQSFILLDSIAEYKSNQMEARKGTLLCAVKLNDSTRIIKSAEKLLATEKVPEELVRMATFNLAKVYQTANPEKALELYKTVAQDVKSAEGAESKFHISEIQFRQGKVDESEKGILDFLDQNSPQQYWLAKSYILWADIFETRKDDFQAKHTLQSIIDNYPEKSDGILDQCQKKLEILNTPPAPEPVPVQQDNADEIQIK